MAPAIATATLRSLKARAFWFQNVIVRSGESLPLTEPPPLVIPAPLRETPYPRHPQPGAF